jgi:hypothetical protein
LALKIRLGTTAKTRNGVSKTTSEIDNENQIKKQFMSLQTFHRTPGGHIQKITAEKQFEPQDLESFDPVTQELYQYLPAMIPSGTYNKSH